MQICDPSSRAAGFGFSGRWRLHQAMEWSGSTSCSPDKGSSAHAGAGSSARRRRRFVGMDSVGRPPGSALAQRLCGSPMPLIQCDDCPWTVLRLTSGTPKHPGWVFLKCENDGVRALAVAHLIARSLVQLRILISNMVILLCRTLDAHFGFGKANTLIY